ncbi:hypothetical protein [Mycoplasma phocoeninasale]|uniref:Uncharacterized protein n=1 Tax=Mycoplasma phocoeninasale TaxID=2726117 RepID=A0A858U2W7_9MOLU|nr:hypothetical protein [Mycoplasma phocoeninasale]MBN0970581.1 hypothetical protein [Mycoplasma phocoeninasale]QJG66301.1 hypothetical protein HGG64_01055 [Mycoplasma phocoeninasale]
MVLKKKKMTPLYVIFALMVVLEIITFYFTIDTIIIYRLNLGFLTSQYDVELGLTVTALIVISAFTAFALYLILDAKYRNIIFKENGILLCSMVKEKFYQYKEISSVNILKRFKSRILSIDVKNIAKNFNVPNVSNLDEVVNYLNSRIKTSQEAIQLDIHQSAV